MKGGGCGVVKAELALFSVDPASQLATPTQPRKVSTSANLKEIFSFNLNFVWIHFHGNDESGLLSCGTFS